MLDFDALRQINITTSPFQFLIAPNFIKQAEYTAINNDFPKIHAEGSFPLSTLQSGPNFQKLIDELQGDEFRTIMAEKFNVNLDGRPTIVTVRGRSGTRDGHIHTDTKTKIITVLLYMNPAWEDKGGRLRLLNAPNNIDDYIAEVPPNEGTLLAFKVSHNSWHGHLPFTGERRVIQLNFVTDQSVVEKELSRHRFSSKIKKIKSLLGL